MEFNDGEPPVIPTFTKFKEHELHLGVKRVNGKGGNENKCNQPACCSAHITRLH